MQQLTLDFGHHTRFILLAYGLAALLFALYLLFRWLKRRRIMRDVRRASQLDALAKATASQQITERGGQGNHDIPKSETPLSEE